MRGAYLGRHAWLCSRPMGAANLGKGKRLTHGHLLPLQAVVGIAFCKLCDVCPGILVNEHPVLHSCAFESSAPDEI